RRHTSSKRDWSSDVCSSDLRVAVDDASNPDWYFYFDTLFPESGLHPYTKDQYTGQMWASSAPVAAFIPDVLTRVRILEGVVRGSAGSTTSADKRIKDLCTELSSEVVDERE